MAIIVLGSGRSGTSMVTGMLGLCGVYLGEEREVRHADQTNEKGSWEHGCLNAINERVLSYLGGSFIDPPRAEPGWECDPGLDPIYKEARESIEKLFGSKELWGWKMPRAIFTLPFWRRVMPDVKIILCMRNPLDFASSMDNYLGFNRSYMLVLWLRYNLAMLENTRPEERFLTSYEEYFPDYRVGFSPILEFLDLPVPEPGSELDKTLVDFHEPGLKHHSSTVEALMDDAEVPYPVKQLYVEMLSGSRDAASIPILPWLKANVPIMQMAIDGHASVIKWGQLADEKRALEQVLSSRAHRAASAARQLLSKLKSIKPPLPRDVAN